jgi:Protein of unknown function, DUF547
VSIDSIAVILLLSMTFPLAAEGDRPLDHSAWNEILRTYVTEESRVHYGALKQRGVAQLDRYLEPLAGRWPSRMTVPEQKAALINAYNALTVRWVVSNYPVESIWQTRHPFTEARHTLDGGKTSLDQIEGRLRDMGDPRLHAAVVCASRSCPPLRREAYEAAHIDAQLDANTRAWLANSSLNDFFPERRLAVLSMIFKWYQGDFQRNGSSVQEFLARFGPAGKSQFLREPGARIEYRTYHWGLNDTSERGRDYSGLQFYWDALRNKVF